MNTLLSTTALVIALGVPSLTFAQTEAPAADAANQNDTTGMSAFLDQRSQSDLFASELMGKEVYARRTMSDETQSQTDANATAGTPQPDDTETMATMNRDDLEDMDNIGEITEIVLSNDGEVRALVIAAGGFLGMGEHDVAVAMDQITFASDPEDRSETYVVLNTRAEMLKESPSYDRMAMAPAGDQQQTTQETRSDRTGFSAPQMERDGYDRVEVTDVSTDMLIGKSVYDVDDNDVGEVTDIIVNADGEVSNVIIDFGGFLGIGSSQASLSFEELTILSTEGFGDVRLYVDATRDQIQNLPQYQASN
ncbi:hypothetical protein GCM10011363_30240 [Marivita lacus]|uniref:PRC-barrel domain-containing protein n=1 Tax=Marivita lacus TaxID=1323742 RepID=A0ABQ1L0P6_9RHOB|nr:PRC-barrel domain-containing protein [Marivita lacus]GGC11592.1 hypothetical protein GCM10011363_30240 [Marivita lacus]